MATIQHKINKLPTELQEQIDNVNDRIKVLNKEIIKKENLIKDYREKNAVLSLENEKLTTDNTELKKEYKTNKNNVISTNKEIGILNNKLIKIKEEMQDKVFIKDNAIELTKLERIKLSNYIIKKQEQENEIEEKFLSLKNEKDKWNNTKNYVIDLISRLK